MRSQYYNFKLYRKFNAATVLNNQLHINVLKVCNIFCSTSVTDFDLSSSVIICTINTKSYDCLGEVIHCYNKNFIRLQHTSAKRSLSRWSTWNCHLLDTDILAEICRKRIITPLSQLLRTCSPFIHYEATSHTRTGHSFKLMWKRKKRLTYGGYNYSHWK